MTCAAGARMPPRSRDKESSRGSGPAPAPRGARKGEAGRGCGDRGSGCRGRAPRRAPRKPRRAGGARPPVLAAPGSTAGRGPCATRALDRRPPALHLHGAQKPDSHARHDSPPGKGRRRDLASDDRRIAEGLANALAVMLHLALNPMAWMISVDGFIVDARTMPPDVQAEARRRGLIPDLPGPMGKAGVEKAGGGERR